jgi:homocysteine S-methyltransferase
LLTTASQLWQGFFDQSGVVILDGGLATELERRGAYVSGPLWSAKVLMEQPELIRQVHEDYFRAGADVGISASYQASYDGFARCGLEHADITALLQRSVRLVQDARDAYWAVPANWVKRCRPLIAASIGCFGAALHDGSEYRGNYGLTVQQLIEWHRPRLEALVRAEPDLLACETIPCLDEATALVRLLAEVPDVSAWLSFSCRDDKRLCQGEPIADAVQLAQTAPNVVAVGINCTPPQYIDGLLAAAREHTTLPLLVYPNSGERWNAARRAWEAAAAPLDWGQAALRWRDLGARLIGGCCRTTPATIHQIATSFRH